MGPRSFERGNNLSLTGNITLAAALQWGRAHSSAEIPSVRLRDRRNVQCFNGAALIRARKLVPVLIRRPLGLRFNGAALIRARKFLTRPRSHPKPGGASMGPRSFERGNAQMVDWTREEIAKLQWGRA